MDILQAIKTFFAPQKEHLSKSLLTLIVAQYGANYIIFDRRNGKKIDESIEFYDARYHTIWIENEEQYREMFKLV